MFQIPTFLFRVSSPTVLQDYCDTDYFQAECPHGAVVVIKEARFGRMALGTCLTEDYGHLDCYK